MILNKPERFFLNLLQFSVNNAPVSQEWDGLSSEDWTDVFCLAERHGLVALLMNILGKIRLKQTPPPVLYCCIGQDQAAHRERICRYQFKLSCEFAEFLRKEDIKCIVLKGLALASYYPDFSKREFGDLDCYLIKNENTVANEGDLLAKRLGWNVEEAGYKHSFDLMNEICMTYLGLDIYAKGLTISSHPEMAESMILDVLRKPTVGSGQLTLLQKIPNIWNRFKRQYKYRFIETESVRTLMWNTIAFSSYMHRNVKLD